MSLEQVLREARRMPAKERFAAWQSCGGEKHPLRDLLRTSKLSGSFRYCERCWTLYDTNDTTINLPLPE